MREFRIKDGNGHIWIVHAITDSYYHMHDEMGNIDFVNLQGVRVGFKKVK